MTTTSKFTATVSATFDNYPEFIEYTKEIAEILEKYDPAAFDTEVAQSGDEASEGAAAAQHLNQRPAPEASPVGEKRGRGRPKKTDAAPAQPAPEHVAKPEGPAWMVSAPLPPVAAPVAPVAATPTWAASPAPAAPTPADNLRTGTTWATEPVAEAVGPALSDVVDEAMAAAGPKKTLATIKGTYPEFRNVNGVPAALHAQIIEDLNILIGMNQQ